MRKYALALAIGLVLGISITCFVLVPRERSAVDRADRLESIAENYRATIDRTGSELVNAREALARSQQTNRELTDRLGAIGNAIATGQGTAIKIREGIDGDIELAGQARATTQKALDRLREISNRSN